MSAITTLTRDIAPGEVFKHKGSLELKGNIGTGAKIDIVDGGIHVTGAVGDDVRIKANGGSSNSISVTGRNNNIVINGDLVGGRVIVNGCELSRGAAAGPSGILVDGPAGTRIVLETDGAIEIKGATGEKAQLRADGSITLENAGGDLSARSGGSFHAEDIATGAHVTSGGSLHIAELAGGSAHSGGSAHIDKIGTDARVVAGGSAHIGRAGAQSRVTAGGSLKVQLAHASAVLSSAGSKKVGRVSGDDAEFRLSQSFSKAAAQDDAPAPATAIKPKKSGFNL